MMMTSSAAVSESTTPTVVFVLGFLVVGVLVLASVAVPPWSAVVILAGIAGILVVMSRLDLAFCFFIASEVLITEDILLLTEKLYPTLYRASLPGIFINPFEAVLLILLVATILSSRGRFVRTTLDIPLLGFGLACVLGYFTCVRLTGDAYRIFEPRRILHFYLVFFLTVNIINTPRRLRLLMWTFAVAVILKSFQGFYLYQHGAGLQIKWRITAIFTGWGDGLNFVTYLIFVLLLLMRHPDGFHWRRWLIFWPLVLFTLVNTFKRAYYVGFAMALGWLFLLEGGRRRVRFILFCALALAFLLGVITVTNSWYAVGQSVWSIFHPTKESSAHYRLVEWKNALISVRSHPWFGIGLGGVLEMVIYLSRTNLLGVHNTYLWVAVKLGFIGLAMYLWLILAFLRRLMCQRHELTDSFLLWVNQGLLLSFIAFLTAQFFAPMFSQMRTSSWMGLVMGLGVMLPYLYEQRSDVKSE
ncbi:MAG: O-antigen ligase family protein [bacterium]